MSESGLSTRFRRALDIAFSAVGLLVLSPIFAVICCAVAVDSPGGVLFRHTRVGRRGRLFQLHKFRTMTAGPTLSTTEVTAGDDPRITRIGRRLRRSKLDELPQLWDVLRGEMSLVGPRPEVPRYVALYGDEDRRILLSVRPGLTDPVSLTLRDEQQLLAGVTAPHEFYVRELLPQKIAMARDYVMVRTIGSDLRILLLTALAVVGYRSRRWRWETRGGSIGREARTPPTRPS